MKDKQVRKPEQPSGETFVLVGPPSIGGSLSIVDSGGELGLQGSARRKLFLRAGNWFEDLSRALRDQLGEEWIWIGSAWALTQDAGLDPLEGAKQVRNMLSGAKPKNDLDQGLARILGDHETPAPPPGALFFDLVDVLLGRSVRSWMGDSSDGGAPVPVDRWALRDAGFVDADLLELLRARGANARDLSSLKIDLVDAASEDQYEYASEFFHEIAAELTRKRWLDRSWDPHQAMSLGRVAIQQSLDVTPVWPDDVLRELKS